MNDPENGIEWTESFAPPFAFPAANQAGAVPMRLPWQFQNNATASVGFVQTGLVTSGPELSAIGMSTNAATAVADLTVGNVANGYNFCLPIGLGSMTFKAKVAIDQLSGVSGENFIDQIGIMRYNLGTSTFAGIYFEYDATKTATWRCCACTGTNNFATPVDTGISVALNQWYKLKFVVTGTNPWSQVQFWVAVGTGAWQGPFGPISVSLPVAGTDLGLAPHFLRKRTALVSAPRSLYLGYFYLLYPFTN
jgi:hypothetical protein